MVTFMASLLAASLPVPASADEEQPPALMVDEAEHLLHLINGYRQEHGLVAFGRSWRLTEAANAHSLDMAVHNQMSHVGSDGADPFARIARYYPYETWLGENIAAGFASAGELLAGWQASPHHNENLLRPEFQVVGLSCAFSQHTEYRWFWTADFGGQADDA
jgi:uncharacterized protein YkwD